MLRSYLDLLNNLCDSTETPPESLGAGTRAPGFQPYLEFLVNSVLLKVSSRRYKNKAEKVRDTVIHGLTYCILTVYVLYTYYILTKKIFNDTVIYDLMLGRSAVN